MVESSNMQGMTRNDATSPVAVSSGVDLISGLQDDLLLRILSLLPAASEVARTSVLSRRWRHLWPNAVTLRFALGGKPETYTEAADGDEARRLIAAAAAVLARRAASGPDVEDVDLGFVYVSDDDGRHFDRGLHYHAGDITSEHVAAWLLFAQRRVTGRFMLAVPNHVDDDEEEDSDDDAGAAADDDEHVLAANLPCSARIQELSLTLGEARLTVPVVPAAITTAGGGGGAFDALTDVFLSYARVDSAAGDDVRLGEILSSSSSPRLRRLRLYHLPGLATLSLDAAGTLEELRLTALHGLTSLRVAAPGLRELGVWACRELSEARIAAPRVRELEFVRHTKLLEFDGAASVRRIEDLQMWSHRIRCSQDDDDDDDYNNNSAAVWLLKNCTGVNSLSLEVMMPVWWSHMMEAHRDDIHEGDIVDMMAEVRQLPNITDLTIEVHAYGHAIGASVAKLIAKCTNVEHLSIYMYSTGEECLDLSCICHHQSADWDSQKLSLEHLRSIEICDMELLDSQIRLVRLLLTSTTSLERMTVELDTSHLEDGEEVDFDIPCYGGRWLPSFWECSELGLFVRPVEYEWTQDMVERV